MIDLYVINLDERIDRWQQIQRDFSNFQEFNLIRIPAIKHKRGKIGCFLSHKKCIQIAKDKGLKYIIVVEDDCIPCQNFSERFKQIKQYLDGTDTWNIYLGGTVKVQPKNIKNNFVYGSERLVEIDKGNSTQFICYNNTIYDFYLNIETNIAVDKIWHNKFNALVSLPFIAYQGGGYSDIERVDIDYTQIIKHTENLMLSEIMKS